MQKRRLNIKQIIADDTRKAAAHEAGHTIVARHFGLDAHPFIWLNDVEGERGALQFCTVLGTTSLELSSPFRNACIAFAGEIAEEMLTGEDVRAEGNCLGVYNMFWADERSASDLQHVEGHPQKWRACKTAWQILTKRRKELEREAKNLARSLKHPLPAKAKRQAALYQQRN